MDATAAAPSRSIDLKTEPQFQLGAVTIDPLSREARLEGSAERLQPQNLKVLIALVRRKGEAVTREQLVDWCWDGRFIGDDVINRAISTLRQFAERVGEFEIETIPRAGYRLVERSPQPKARRWGPAALAAGLILAGGSAYFLRTPAPAEAPTLSIQPSSPSSDAASAARGIAVRIAGMEATNAYRFHLIEPGAADGADLILQVDGGRSVRDLSLVLGKDRTILWAGHFQQPAAGIQDVADQAGMAATMVLSCALDALSHPSEQVTRDTLRLYINGCARLAGELDATAAQVIPVFEKIVEQAPRFAAGWDQLLYAEALALPWERDPRLLVNIRRHLDASRERGIDVQSGAIAEAALLPMQAYAKRIEVLRRGLARHPRAALLELALADALMDVGRRSDAMGRARDAAALDPISPAIRGEYVWILAHSGRIEEARKQLEIAERLWPGAPKIYSVRLSFEVRYGDPRAAIDVIRRGAPGGSAQMTAYAEARLDPSTANVDRAVSLGKFGYEQVPESFSVLLQPLAQFGRTDEAIQELLRVPDTTVVHTEPFFRPMMRTLWRDPRFIQAMSRWGLVTYWRQSGKWPDFCFDTHLPYDCRKEAAKYANL